MQRSCHKSRFYKRPPGATVNKSYLLNQPTNTFHTIRLYSMFQCCGVSDTVSIVSEGIVCALCVWSCVNHVNGRPLGTQLLLGSLSDALWDSLN